MNGKKIGHGRNDRLEIDRDIRRLGGERRGRAVTEIRRDTIYAGDYLGNLWRFEQNKSTGAWSSTPTAPTTWT